MANTFKKNISNFKFQLIIVFILITFLCYFFPYTGDDWAWGTEVGIERLNSFFRNYNGRYVGNLLVLALTRSTIIKSLVMALVIVLLCYNIYFFINKENKKIFWISLIFLLLTPKLIAAQTVVWLSGFTNYVVPTLFILMYFNLFSYVFESQVKFKKRSLFYALALGLLNSMIMENITLFNIAISFLLLIYTYWKFKKIDYAQIIFLIATLIGAIFMFTNGAYSMIASDQDNYRSVAQESNIIISSVQLYFDKIYIMFFVNNKLISSFISIMGLLTINKFKKSNLKLNASKVLKIIEFILVFYVFFIVMKTITPNWVVLQNYTKYIEGFAVISWCLALLGLIMFQIKKAIMKKALISLISYVILLAPLFVVNPVWNRNVFPLYIMLVVFGLCLYDYNKDVWDVKFNHLILIVLASYLYMVSIYGYVYYSDQKRIDKIEDEKANQDVLEILELPYQDYLWMSEPNGDMWIERYKLFYDIPADTQLKFIDREK